MGANDLKEENACDALVHIKHLPDGSDLKNDLLMKPSTTDNTEETPETDTIVDENAMDTSIKELMELTGSSIKPKYSKATLKDKDGNYPKWLSSRKIQNLKSKGKKKSAGKVGFTALGKVSKKVNENKINKKKNIPSPKKKKKKKKKKK